MPIYRIKARALMEFLRANKKEFNLQEAQLIFPHDTRNILWDLELDGFLSTRFVKRGKGGGPGRPHAIFYFNRSNLDKIKRVFGYVLVEEGIIMPDD